MEPGVDLDAAIVRKVFRRVVVVDSATGEMALKDRATNKNLPIPKYSTEMSATYVLVKYFHS
ncbi:hypothetical protein, partial [Escherichia coli]|uniref:hypothetical protein n=1 Tax=Escherichia coli TaxID=562 RepID=UPI0019646B40